MAESGLQRPRELAACTAAGVGAFLIGEHLVRHDAPGAALARLRARMTHGFSEDVRHHHAPSDAEAVAAAGADAIGLNFWPTERRAS